jgi:hypothetical protein
MRRGVPANVFLKRWILVAGAVEDPVPPECALGPDGVRRPLATESNGNRRN